MNLFEEVFKDMLDGLVVEKSDTDYMGDDGFLHCGICGEPKEAPLPKEIQALFPEKKSRPRLCRCDRERVGYGIAAQQEEQAKLRIDRMRSEGLYSEMYRECRFENDDGRDERASKVARNYAEHFNEYKDGDAGIMFWGGVGTGKSYLAACIANYLIEHCVPVVMASVQSLVARMTADFGKNRESVLDEVGNAELLILDDLGVERETDFMLEHVYDLVNTRYLSKKPLIVTSNLSPNQLNEDGDIRKKRIYDRIVEKCQPVKMGGESRRKGISKEKTALFMKILSAGGMAEDET